MSRNMRFVLVAVLVLGAGAALRGGGQALWRQLAALHGHR
jgi:hypothetical protein